MYRRRISSLLAVTDHARSNRAMGSTFPPAFAFRAGHLAGVRLRAAPGPLFPRRPGRTSRLGSSATTAPTRPARITDWRVFSIWTTYPQQKKRRPSYGKRRKKPNYAMKTRVMAERMGFEPTIPLQVCRISSAVHSTTLPPLRMRERLRCALLININGRADKGNFVFVSQIVRHGRDWRNASAFGGFYRHF